MGVGGNDGTAFDRTSRAAAAIAEVSEVESSSNWLSRASL